jgi:hypothetical protein
VHGNSTDESIASLNIPIVPLSTSDSYKETTLRYADAAVCALPAVASNARISSSDGSERVSLLCLAQRMHLVVGDVGDVGVVV